MSDYRKITAICPQCGKEIGVSAPESINMSVNPQDGQKLIDGTLFEAACSCGAKISIDFPVLYHDPEKRIMIYYVKPEAVARTEAMFSALRMNPDFGQKGYQLRVATDQETLREKAMIFSAGMDDRVMEVIKLTYILYMRRKYPKERIIGALFVSEGEKYMLQTVGSVPVESEISREFYDQLHAQYAPRLANESSARVDFDWAVHFLGYDKA